MRHDHVIISSQGKNYRNKYFILKTDDGSIIFNNKSIIIHSGKNTTHLYSK